MPRRKLSKAERMGGTLVAPAHLLPPDSPPPQELPEPPAPLPEGLCLACGEIVPPHRRQLHAEGADGCRPECPHTDLREVARARSRLTTDLATAEW